MNTVRKQIVKDLFNALHEANCAGVETGDYANDLDNSLSAQNSLYGCLSDALRILEPELLDDYIETGDRPTL